MNFVDRPTIILVLSAVIAIIFAVTVLPDMVPSGEQGRRYGKTIVPYYYSSSLLKNISCTQHVLGRFIVTKC